MSASDGTIVGTTQIVNAGPASICFNLALVSEGYQQAQMAKWATDAQSLVNQLLGAPPFNAPDLGCAFNVFRVDVTSTDSGADDPAGPCGGAGTTARTYFDATFCATGRIQRLLTADTALVKTVLDAQVLGWHSALVVVNSPIYGGSGGQIPVAAANGNWRDVALHELGHSFFGLADEYEYYRGCGTDAAGNPLETDRNNHPTVEPAAPNATVNSNRSTIKWADLVAAATPIPTTSNPNCANCDPQASPVAAGTVGAFEGADRYHCGAFRPEFDCEMRTLGQPFCAICQRRIRELLAPFLWDDWYPIGNPADGATVPSRSKVWPAVRPADSNRLDIFVVGHNGGIYTSGKTGPGKTGMWEAWHPIGDPAAGENVPDDSVVSAAGRGRSRLDIFVVGHDGGIYTSGKTGYQATGSWESWHPIGNPSAGEEVPTRSVVWPVARETDGSEDRLDVFVVGHDGGIYTSGKTGVGDAGTWEAWDPIGNPALGENVPTLSVVWAVARDTDRLDVFVVGHNGGIYTAGKTGAGNAGAWEAWHPIGDPAAGHNIPTRSVVGAAARGSDRLDVFVVGHDGGIYTSGKTGAGNAGAWEPWHPIGDPGAGQNVPTQSWVWPVAYGPDRLDIFVVGHNGGIYTSGKIGSAGSGSWMPWYPVGDPGAGQNVPTRSVVSAASRGSGALDIFVVGHNGGIYSNRLRCP